MALHQGNSIVIAVCDGCGPDWWASHTDAQPLFTDVGHARSVLASEFGWRPDGFKAGARMLCPSCAVREDCVRRGYHEPVRPALDPTAASSEAWAHLRVCQSCHRVLRDLPPAHPDIVWGDIAPAEAIEFQGIVNAYATGVDAS